MYLKLTRSGGHSYAQLVESFRNEDGKPRQRTHATLGRLDEVGGGVDSLLHGLLRAKGLDGFFEQVFGGDSFEKKKPDPLPLRKTCQALGSAPARTLMVGDSSNDAQAARAAGCPVVLTTYGYNHGQPVRAVDADAWVDSLVELLAKK